MQIYTIYLLFIISLNKNNVMNRKVFLTRLPAIGILPFAAGFASLGEPEVGKVSPKMDSPELKNSYWYIGHLMSILISSKDTNGTFSLIHGYEIKGLEPPPHVHTKEDESFYILDGEINYTVDKEVFNARRGDWIFLPRNVQHSFQVQSDQAEVIIHLSPGGFEEYFKEMSEPAKALIIPPRPQGPPDVKRIIETASKYGVKFPGLG
jgi:quercetin dioxygenase-like cupin family protein